MAVRIMRAALSRHLHFYASKCISLHMSDKDRRQRAIADLIRGAALANQEELGERLTGLGYAVTQATISRDLEQLGAVKVRRGGGLSYAMPDQLAAPVAAGGPELDRIIRDW